MAVAQYIAARRDAGEAVDVTVYDAGDSSELHSRAIMLRKQSVRVVLKASCLLEPVDLCIASPGIPPTSQLRRSAREMASRTISEIEFAFERSHSPWLAVTGTNGKTTVTSLVAHLLREGGVPVECVGNIGDPAIGVVDTAGPSTAIVAEVSSFQLALTQQFRPRVSVLLNITPDHIDWHGSLEAYAADKARVFQNQGSGDTAVINIDDSGSARYADDLELRGIRVVRVSRKNLPVGGAGLVDGVLTLDCPSGPVPLLSASDLRIRGDHNVSNALAAAAAACAWGVTPDNLRSGLASFAPVPHRLETVGVFDGIEYVNDSKATNPASVLAALSAFSDQKIVLLLGGRNKGSTFFEVAEAAKRACRAIVAFGEARDEIASAIRKGGSDPVVVPTLADGVDLARSLALPGDVVLLSPGCASFDEFEGYAHRGQVFAELVSRSARKRL